MAKLRVPRDKRLVAAELKAERLIDVATRETIDSLQRAVGNFTFRAKELLKEVLAGRGDATKLAEILDIHEQLAQALMDAGMQETLDVFEGRFRSIERMAVDYYGEFGLPKTRAGLDAETLNAFKALQSQDFLDLVDSRFVEPIADAVIQGVVGRQPREDILASVTKIVAEEGMLTRSGEVFTAPQIETLVNDGFRRHLRETKRQKAEALGMEVVWFQGPHDEKTSDQCVAMLTEGPHGVPNMWYVDEFTSDIHEDIQGDPITQGGHFNCRHTVSIVPLSFAVTKGFEVPEEDVEAETEDIEQEAEAEE